MTRKHQSSITLEQPQWRPSIGMSGAAGILAVVAALLAPGGVRCLAAVSNIDQRVSTNGFYTVQGRADYDTFGRGAHLESTFTLTVSNRSWAMEVLPVRATAIIGGRQVFDGVNLVSLRYYEASKIDRSWVGDRTDGYVSIDNTGTPDAMEAVAPAIWVAYAAQFYLLPGNNGMLRPCWHPEREVRQNVFVPARWKLLSSASALPESIDFFYNAKDWDKAFHRTTAANTAPQHSETEVLVAAYQSFGRTNLGGRPFPLGFVFTGFAAERELETGLRMPVTRVEVTNVTVRPTVEQRLFDTVFRGVALVEDFRSQGKYPLDYFVTNAPPYSLSGERKHPRKR